MGTDSPVKNWRQPSVSLMEHGATTTRCRDVLVSNTHVPAEYQQNECQIWVTSQMEAYMNIANRQKICVLHSDFMMVYFPLHTVWLCSGSMSQHRVVLSRAWPLEDCQWVTLRIQDTYCVHLWSRILQARPRPHRVLIQRSLELEEWKAALSG